MNSTIAKLKIRDKILTNQNIIALLVRPTLFLAKAVPNSNIRMKLYDTYLRFNFADRNSQPIIKEAVKAAYDNIYAFRLEINNDYSLKRSIILKKYVSPKDKGVMLISFEKQLLKVAALPAFNELEKNYHFIFVPSWQPFYSPELYLFLSRLTKPFWIMPSSSRDSSLCKTVGRLCLPLPFQASSWVDGDKYAKVDGPRDIDIIMVANFSEYKRHWILFDALREMDPRLNVILAGRPLGNRTREVLLTEAASFGVADRITIFENPSDEEIMHMLLRSKLFCAFSHKEGSYISVAEAMFAGVPVAMFEDAIIGSKDYINDATGRLIFRKGNIAAQLTKLLEEYLNFNPAEWANANISAKVNCYKLNNIIKKNCMDLGYQWSEDIRPFYCKNFNFHYYSQPDWLDAEIEQINIDFDLKIHRPQ